MRPKLDLYFTIWKGELNLIGFTDFAEPSELVEQLVAYVNVNEHRPDVTKQVPQPYLFRKHVVQGRKNSAMG